jgi:hypothetical protein
VGSGFNPLIPLNLHPEVRVMTDAPAESLNRLLARIPDLLPALEAAYKDIHAHPELSMQER